VNGSCGLLFSGTGRQLYRDVPVVMKRNEMFSVQSMCTARETAHYSLKEDFSIATTEPRGYRHAFSTTSQQGYQEAKRNQVSSHQTEWPGDSSEAETVPGVASVQARAPARREGGREFQALGPDAQKDWSPTVFNFGEIYWTLATSDHMFNRTSL